MNEEISTHKRVKAWAQFGLVAVVGVLAAAAILSEAARVESQTANESARVPAVVDKPLVLHGDPGPRDRVAGTGIDVAPARTSGVKPLEFTISRAAFPKPIASITADRPHVLRIAADYTGEIEIPDGFAGRIVMRHAFHHFENDYTKTCAVYHGGQPCPGYAYKCAWCGTTKLMGRSNEGTCEAVLHW